MSAGRIGTSKAWAGFRMGWLLGLAVLSGTVSHAAGGASLVIDHRHVDIAQWTEAQILRAKATLHVAYGHTSHGSQLTDGMSGLVGFANGGGKGLALPQNIFSWNDGGTGGALDLHDYALCNDVGYYPDWVRCTTNYLNNPANSNVNVVIWSWCGQMGGKYAAGTLTNEYLQPMATLEARYPHVVFVYMTGHVDIWDDADNKAACAAIRNWCASNGRVLYDFNDIERYDPNGTYYPYVNDDCSVYNAGGTWIGNWATAWQNSHVKNKDWYDCGSAHSEPLNANQKAYAAWALWCRLAERLQAPALSVASAGTNLSSAAASGRQFSVSASVAWTASTNVPWLALAAGHSGTGNGTVVYSVATNDGANARTGTITVAGGGITCRFAVVQAAPVVQSPAGGITTMLRQPAFTWTPTPDATWYRLWISRNGQAWLDRWVSGTHVWQSASGMPGGAYRWWVQPWGPSLGFGDWAGPAEFSIHFGAPGLLTQLEPVGPQAGIQLTYRWDKNLDATWYHLWVGRLGAGTWHDRWYEITGIGVAEAAPAASYPGPAKPVSVAPAGACGTNRPTFTWNGGECHWWVQGWGPDGLGPWSGPKAFSIPHAAGTWYRVYVNRGATMAFDRWTNGANLPAPNALASGAHSWWLGVWDAARSQTIWSDRVDFTVP